MRKIQHAKTIHLVIDFASRFDLNNVTYNYNTWLKAVETGTDEEKAFENLVVTKTQLEVGDMVVFGKKYGRVTKILGKDISVHVESESSGGKCTTDKIVKRDKIKIVKKPWCQTQAWYGKLLQHFKAKRSGKFKGEFLVYPDIEKESVVQGLKGVSGRLKIWRNHNNRNTIVRSTAFR